MVALQTSRGFHWWVLLEPPLASIGNRKESDQRHFFSTQDGKAFDLGRGIK